MSEAVGGCYILAALPLSLNPPGKHVPHTVYFTLEISRKIGPEAWPDPWGVSAFSSEVTLGPTPPRGTVPLHLNLSSTHTLGPCPSYQVFIEFSEAPNPLDDIPAPLSSGQSKVLE